MLPMGTIMAVCMLLGVIFAVQLGPLKKIPDALNKIVGVVVLVAGLWNLCWYGVQHLTEFWGIAAAVSGIVMLVTGVFLLAPQRLPEWLRRLRPLWLLLLLGFCLLYGITIARL